MVRGAKCEVRSCIGRRLPVPDPIIVTPMTGGVSAKSVRGDHPAPRGPHSARVKRSFRPTNATLYLILVMVFVLLGAVNYRSNAAYLVLAVVMSTAVVSLLHAWRNLSDIRITPGRTFPVFAGEPLRAQVTLTGGQRDSWALVIDAPDVAEDDGVPLVHLPAHTSSTVELVLPGRRRGLHALGRVRMASVYPLGLLTVTMQVPASWSWVVYPAPLAGGREADGEGDDHVVGVRSGTTGDFHGHRPYQPGEPHRRIDWRAVARGRPLMVKDYTIGGLKDCWLAWDDDRIADVEVHLSVLAGRVLAAEHQRQRYGLRLPGRTIAIDGGEDHYHVCMQALALFEGTP